MQIRYFIEYKLQQDPVDGHHYYHPIGVWAQGPGPGLDICMQYLPGYEEEQWRADSIINDLVERGVRSLPDDFLDDWRERMPLYRGDRGEIKVDGVSISLEIFSAIILQTIHSRRNKL